MTKINFLLNGKETVVDAEPIRPLAHILRDDLGFTGTKIGCDAGDCGACTISLNGQSVCSCLTPIAQVKGSEIITVEGLSENNSLNDLQEAFHLYGAAQCGICTPGMLIAASDLLQRNDNPNEEEIYDALGGVLCRCTGYRKIVEAILHIGNTETANIVVPAVGEAVGSRAAKVDGRQKIDGTELYGADQAPADSLWLRAVRSPYWRATFTLGDFGPLKTKYPGLVDILSAEDVTGVNGFGIYPDI